MDELDSKYMETILYGDEKFMETEDEKLSQGDPMPVIVKAIPVIVNKVHSWFIPPKRHEDLQESRHKKKQRQ